jgi:hypothetical protein
MILRSEIEVRFSFGSVTLNLTVFAVVYGEVVVAESGGGEDDLIVVL